MLSLKSTFWSQLFHALIREMFFYFGQNQSRIFLIYIYNKEKKKKFNSHAEKAAFLSFHSARIGNFLCYSRKFFSDKIGKT